MHRDLMKSIAATSVMILFGILVLVTGERSLIVLVPAALLVWFAAKPRFRTDRN